MREFWELQVWQEAHKYALMVYKLTAKWPREEMFGLTNQVRRSSSSVGSNIAEGFGRFNDKEFHNFCNIGKGSLHESQSQLLLGRDLEYNTHEEWKPVHEQSMVVARMLLSFMRSLRPS